MLDENVYTRTITDLKQYIYCPRIFFYHACLPDVRPVTAKMTHGITAHEAEQKRAARRSLHQYHILEGQRHFDMPVYSERLRLTGHVDEVVESDEGLFPVDYKMAKKAGNHFKIQLTAYAMLLEETTGQTIKQGYLYMMRSREMIPVRFTKKLRAAVEQAVVDMWNMVDSELMPPPPSDTHRCVDCEFRRFCNDV